MMKKSLPVFLCTGLLWIGACGVSYGQENRSTLVCRNETFAALKPLPKLAYKCRADDANDYDEAILKRPERIRAINELLKTLGSLADGRWWESKVEDLNLCYFSGKPGALSVEEREKFESGDYGINLFGNDRIRLVLAADPCYQTSYSGSNAFLLYRKDGKVHATTALDGYFSRADNSISLGFATQNREQIIEIVTYTGGLNPYTTNYYFVINEKTGKAVPKNLFREGKRPTNKITSAMNMSDANGSDSEMRIIKENRLARTFFIYEDDPEGKTDENGRSLTKRVYSWNGRFYVRVK